jgi:hypothetical protein
MRRTITLVLAAALFGILAAVVVAQVGQDAPAGAPTATTDTTETTETTDTTVRETTPQRTTEDISGPCDEAEHANDPRCAGVAAGNRFDDDRDVDDHGHHGHRGGDDHSGPRHGGGNSGPGSVEGGDDGVEDDSGNSGPGGGDWEDDSGGDDSGGDDSGGHGGSGSG